jgi:hypothetical protein
LDKINISFHLNESIVQPVRISRLIQGRISKVSVDKLLNVEFSVSSGLIINIIDDLFCNKFFNTKVSFKLESDSKLCFFSCMKAGVGVLVCDCSSCHIGCDEFAISKKIIVSLDGCNSKAEIRQVYFGGGKRSFNLETIQLHAANGTSSSIEVKAVLDRQSSMKCDNLIFVSKILKNVVSKQKSRFMLLSDDAKVVVRPKLEILSDDAKCSHGAAIGKINADNLFYLQSRGIDFPAARKILIKAFLS